MKKIKETLKKIFHVNSISRQISWSIVLVSMVILSCLGALIFSISKRNIEKDYQNGHEYNLQLFSRSIESYYTGLVSDLRGLLSENSFMNALSSDTGSGFYFSTADKLILEKEMYKLLDSESSIEGMFVANKDGAFRFLTKTSDETNNLRSYYLGEENILDTKWVEKADELKGKEAFFGYNVLYENEDLTSIVKAMNRNANGETAGYVVLLVRKSFLDQTFNLDGQDYETNRYMVVDLDQEKAKDDENYSLVYYNGNEDAKEEILNAYINKEKNNTYLFSAYHDDISGWEIINVIEKRELSQESAYIGWITVGAALVLTLLTFIISKLLARKITRPLDTLETVIAQVGEGNYHVEEEFDDSEIGRVGNRFKNMANNNLELHEKLLKSTIQEREAELLLLQSQINPHFLYNTLDALYFMAVIDNVDDIAEMVKSLSDTFKLSLNKGDKFISVRDELKKIKAYMRIQNMRYQNRFELRIEVDEDIAEEQILTFILQPVVENSVYHGLEPKVGNGSITIVGYRDVDDEKLLHFIINDTGVGIDDMEKLKSGYGVKNVNERMKLAYGEGYGVVFESVPGDGTTAFFTLPVIEKRCGKCIES